MTNTLTAKAITQEMMKATAGIFDAMNWAEEEIEHAQHRHGERGQGRIWKAGFMLVRPDLDRVLASELLFRSHAAELLDRLAKGQDTRPATTAEMIAVLMDAALAAPLSASAFCLYARLFSRAFPQAARDVFADTGELDPAAYEAVHGAKADEHEAVLRRSLHQESRTPKPTA